MKMEIEKKVPREEHHVKTNVLSLGLAIQIVISFLFIQISYNGTPSVPLISYFIQIINWAFNGLQMYFVNGSSWHMIEVVVSIIIFIFIFLFTALFRKFIKFNLLFFVFLWILILYMYKGIFEVDIYIITSIPFFNSIIFFWYASHKKKL
jgi:hypothetical protein